MKIRRCIVVAISILVLAGCNLPSNGQATPESPDAVFTQAAQTVAAELTRVASTNPNEPTLNTPTSTFTLQPSITQNFSPTNTTIPCLLVSYSSATIDQTVPDNTIMAPGQAFVKTWRLTNAGTCTWNSSYQLVFDHGDRLGVPVGYSQTLTAGTVAQGQTVDVSVNLTAPAAPGTYTGYWRFRDPNGVLFGIGGAGAWVVKIKVVNSTTLTLLPVAPGTESGTIRATAGPFPDFTVGESNTDNTITVETFLSYDITGIPANATITEAKTDFTAYTIHDNPFGLGVLRGYVTDYGATLDSADFVAGFPGGNILDWGSTAALDIVEASPELKTSLQAKLGSNRLILRLQFAGSNMDANLDRLTFTNPKLIVTFTTP